MQATYTDIERLIESKTPFKGSSASAKIVDYVSDLSMGRLYDHKDLMIWAGKQKTVHFYVVYSYSTPILVVTDTGKCWINPHRYSTTTSRLQNIIRQVWPEE